MSPAKRRTTRKRNSNDPSWLPVVWIVVASVVVIAGMWWLWRDGGEPSSAPPAEIDVVLRETAERHGVAEADLEADREIRKVDGVFVRSWTLTFPTVAAREEFIAEMSILGDRGDVSVGEPLTAVGGRIGLRIDHGAEAFALDLGTRPGRRPLTRPSSIAAPTPMSPTPTVRPEPPPGARGRLAVLLDDAGQRAELAAMALRLPEQVGVAVLPFLPYSMETALEVGDAGHEVWLHLPMEAINGKNPGPGALMVSMRDDELRDAVHMAVNNIPNLVGVNNHMGSRATADLKMMTWVMQELAAMDLAFLDSRTTVDTVAEEAARAQGVKTGRRHVFLDNTRTREAVRAQLDEAVYRARMDGECIAIGHLNDVTVGVLEGEIPKLDGRGVTLVRPTALLR